MLLDNGHEVIFIDSRNPYLLGSTYRFLPYPKALNNLQGKFRSLNRFVYRVHTLQLKQIWKSVKPDNVHVHRVDNQAKQYVQAKLHPLVLTCWGSDINNLFESKYQDKRHIKKTITVLS